MKFTIENERTAGNLEFVEMLLSPLKDSGYRPNELIVSSMAGCFDTLLQNGDEY
ncbi:MAG TPA: hypothetical protein VIG80_05440 [Bacillaceae bacterium]